MERRGASSLPVAISLQIDGYRTWTRSLLSLAYSASDSVLCLYLGLCLCFACRTFERMKNVYLTSWKSLCVLQKQIQQKQQQQRTLALPPVHCSRIYALSALRSSSTYRISSGTGDSSGQSQRRPISVGERRNGSLQPTTKMNIGPSCRKHANKFK